MLILLLTISASYPQIDSTKIALVSYWSMGILAVEKAKELIGPLLN